ncbi:MULTISPECIES: fimbrial protein [Citrobacter]|uniref:fimbrial protein n=1 Tax=Citrobacter TaxID=544 RepID=UPI00214D63EC|nr:MULTISPECIES: fimbrial protein [Citrobacter]MCR3698019.1 type 1 fimbrial protein [Citrobacter portucalensis]MDM2899603.1 type 1 fimbrial protein [Citrobacter sp. Cpo037]
MSTKGKFLACSMVLLPLLSLNANADGPEAGTIHFTGEIIEPSCELSDKTPNVPLGTYPTSLFTQVGDESTLTPFSIQLDNCPLASDGLPQVQLTFQGTSALTKSGELLDVSQITTRPGETAATGVGIAISQDTDQSNTLLKLDGTEGQVYIGLPHLAGDSISAGFFARYKAFATPVTAGPADGDLTVNILYR